MKKSESVRGLVVCAGSRSLHTSSDPTQQTPGLPIDLSRVQEQTSIQDLVDVTWEWFHGKQLDPKIMVVDSLTPVKTRAIAGERISYKEFQKLLWPLGVKRTVEKRSDIPRSERVPHMARGRKGMKYHDK